MNSHTSNLVSISEAAKYMGVSIMTLRRWHKSGAFPASFISSGKHRYYSIAELEKYAKGVIKIMEEWAKAETPFLPQPEYYCETSDIFKTRLERMAKELDNNSLLNKIASLVSSAVGEIGNNSFDHNIGNWPDIRGVFFAYDLKKRIVALADRGQGVLTTLRRARPNLATDADALHVAFTEIVTGRAPEHRGNGLKYVRDAIEQSDSILHYQSGNAVLDLQGSKSQFTIITIADKVQGCMAHIKY